MTKEVIVEELAKQELRRGARWYERQQQGAGDGLVDAFDDVIDALEGGTSKAVTVPGVPNETGVRRILLERYPYAIIHIEVDGVVYVLAVAHFKRRPNYWMGRLRRVLGTAPPKRR